MATPAIADLDRDGVPDLIATIDLPRVSREVEAAITVPRWQPRPESLRIRRSSPGGSSWPSRADRAELCGASRSIGPSRRRTYPAWTRSATPVRGRNRSMVAYLDGSQWIGLEPATGRRRGRADRPGLRARSGRSSTRTSTATASPRSWRWGRARRPSSSRWPRSRSRPAGPLWTATIHARTRTRSTRRRPPDWPLVVDLDGDGRSEIVVPGLRPAATRGRLPRRAAARWRLRPDAMGPADAPGDKGGDGLVQILDAPDLDRRRHPRPRGDLALPRPVPDLRPRGNGRPNRSGSTSMRSRARTAIRSGGGTRITPTDEDHARSGPLRWWGRGPDGWPLLAVPMGGRSTRGRLQLRDVASRRSSTSSRPRRAGASSTAVGLGQVGVADLDGDGLADLWGEADGQLRAFRGEAPEAWRALGRFVPADEPAHAARADAFDPGRRPRWRRDRATR